MSAARDKVIGSTIRNTAAMLLTVIGELQVNTVAVARVALVAQDAPVALVGPVGLGNPAVPVALVVSESPVVPESPGVPAVLESRAVRVVGVLQDRARSRRRVPAGSAVPTRLAIAAFLLVQVHMGVPSAVAGAVATGIMLEQAAAEAARAWAAAPGTAAAAEAMAAAVAVVVAAAVVVVAAAAAAAGGRR